MTLYKGMTLKDRYGVLRPLGEGGMGAAYLVKDTRLGRHSVIKEVLSHDTTSREQFEHEACLLAQLRHQNLPVVHDYFFAQDHPYIVMEYVEGQTLDDLRGERSAPFESHDVLKWARDLLDALCYMHAQEPPVIHRDIKPQNVCITLQGEAVLLDFGIARRLDETKTGTAARVFSPGYAPIEQYHRKHIASEPSVLKYVEDLRSDGIRTGPYTDVYSVGATLYYTLTLFRPTAASMRVLGERLPSIERANPEAPDFLVDAVKKALALHPRDRFQAAAAMLAALQPETAETPTVRLQSRPPRPLPIGEVEALGQKLVYIPAGDFLMGSDDPRLKDACHPQHTVDVGAYCLGRCPVTNVDYQRFIDNNPDYPVPYSPMRYAQRYNWDQEARTYPRGLEDNPVVLVTWEDARAYCRWMTQVTGYQCRLPTEAEWEKAAAAEPPPLGSSSQRSELQAKKRKYPWGDEFDEERCNVDAHGALRLESSPVGQCSPAGDSPYGLVDMAGNVWEWTASLYQPYPYDAGDGREDPDAEGKRVVRGGAFDEDPLLARCAWRNGVQPDLRLANVGFRVAASAS